MVISIAIVLGIVIGNYISTKKFTLDKDRKINAVLNLIQSEYVDSIDVKALWSKPFRQSSATSTRIHTTFPLPTSVQRTRNSTAR